MKKIYDIESSIKEVKEWMEKHPNMKLSPKVKDENFKDNTELKEEYDKMRKLYEYLRAEKSKNNMSDEQINRCKEANIGGVFGYSEKYEEIVKAWGCSIESLLEILAQYGSIEGFYDAYVNDKVNTYQLPKKFEITSRVFPKVYDIEMNNNRNYNVLASAIAKQDSKKELSYYSKSHLEEVINNHVTELEMKVLKLRFGLEDGIFRTLETTGEFFNVNRERIRQVEARALRKLRNHKYHTVTKLDLSELKEEEKEEVFEANKKLSIIDTPIEEKEQSNEVIKKYIDKQNKRIQKEKEEKQEQIKEELKANPNYEFENMSVYDFTYDESIDMSHRLSNCLRRSYMFYNKKVQDILKSNIKEIRKIRNIGNKTVEELLNILEKKGYVLNEDGNFVEKETIENNTNAVENKDTSIKMVFNTPESVKQENDVLRKEIEEKQQKSELLDELIKLFDEQEELKNQNSQLDEEIKQKLAILNQKGITYEKK